MKYELRKMIFVQHFFLKYNQIYFTTRLIFVIIFSAAQRQIFTFYRND